MTHRINVTAARSALEVLEGIGQRVIDFGLSGLLDRIERDFGKRTAKGLTLLIAVAVVSVCLSVTFNMLWTAVGFATGAIVERGWLQLLISGAVNFATLLVLLGAIGFVPMSLHARRGLKEIDEAYSEQLTILRRMQQREKNLAPMTHTERLIQQDLEAFVPEWRAISKLYGAPNAEIKAEVLSPLSPSDTATKMPL